MSKDIHVYSTLSNDQRYTTYQKGPQIQEPKREIFIAGKANVADKHCLTPFGMATRVTAEELAELKANEMFCIHVANGFITFSEAKSDADQVAASMTGRDASAPLVEQDFTNEGQEAPTSNKAKKRK